MHSDEWNCGNNKTEKYGMESVVVYFNVLFQYFPEGLRCTTKNFRQDSVPSGQESNPRLLKYDEIILTT
jgi:hypothetical protein